MTDEKIIQVAIEELENMSWGVTEQFLEIHNIAYKNDLPEIAHIIRNDTAHNATVYLRVEGQKFYFVVGVDYEKNPSLSAIFTEHYVSISLHITSDTMSTDELRKLTHLQPSQVQHQGEQKKSGTYRHSKNKLIFEPDPKPGEFETKLEHTLSFFESDMRGIKQLVASADCLLRIVVVCHNGNSMLGGVSIPGQSLKRLAALDIDIDFDLYAEGKQFNEG